MQWDAVGIYLLIIVIAAAVILWAIFGRRIRASAREKGREAGFDSSQRIAQGDLGKLRQALTIDSSDAVSIVDEAVSTNKRVTALGAGRWNLRIIAPDDIEFRWSDAGRLHVVSSRESLGVVTGGRDWAKVMSAVEAAAAGRQVATVRTTVSLTRSPEKVGLDHVWFVD